MVKEIFKKYTDEFESFRDKDNNKINIHYLSLWKDDKSYIHSFNNFVGPCDIRSISKTVMTLLTGIVKDLYPDFDEDTFIYQIIKDIIDIGDDKTKEMFKKIQVKHLLTHTIGYDKVLLMRDDIKDMDPDTYLDYIVNNEIRYNPGEYYLYSNAGFYILGVVLETFINEDLLTFANRHLFYKLDIVDHAWEKYGDYLAAATRLWLRPEDLLKIGQVFLSKGVYNQERIVSETWIEYMQTFTVETPSVDQESRVFRRYAYAKGMWLAKDPSISFAHGTDGQILILLPKVNAIILTLANQNNLKDLEAILNDMVVELLNQ
ncbi:MAG: serine hydrolase [Erysipelothrix sp.]|nr:serine hydrolase [Erysipelothrix sp.]